LLRAPTKWAVVFAEKRGCRAGATAGPARAAFRQNEMAVDLKDVDLKDIDLKSPPARQNEMAAAILPKRCPTAIPNSLVFSRLNDYYSQKKSLFVLFDAVAMESVN